MQNIMAGFCAAGVFPFDRCAVNVCGTKKRISLAERSGLKFIPLCSPSHRKPEKAVDDVAQFSSEVIAKFEVRWEEGYDIPDQRYDEWVRLYNPEASQCCRSSNSSLHGESLPLSPSHTSNSCSTLPHSTVLTHIIADQAPPLRLFRPSLASGRVLTSS